MTTLAANTIRAMEVGDHNDIGVIAADIIFEGAATGDNGAGYARPLVGGDRFLGFALAKADNSAGSAGDLNVRLSVKGQIQLSVSGAVITDVGQPVYATDDDTFVFLPTGASFIGRVKRFVSSGVVVVAFDVECMVDPYGAGPRETIADNKTLDIEDTGKTFFVTTDAKVITLPATATPLVAKIVNIGAFGTVLVAVSPDAADKIQGPNLPGTDNKDHLNTKATARRGDFVVISNAGDANGPIVLEQVGTWATEG